MKHASAPIACLGAVLLAVACGDLKTANTSSPGAGSGSESDSDGTSPSTSGSGSGSSSPGSSSSSGGGGSSSSGSPLGPGKGAGPYGALPFGYCCTSDDECRYRHCADVGGQKMCLDECDAPGSCQGKGLPAGFTCDGTRFEPGTCRPPSGFTCVPANTFVTGTKSSGSCCTPTGDALSGTECAGGHCDWYKLTNDPDYEPPWFCTNHCEVPADCGSGLKCNFDIGKCVPANEPFVCE